MIVGLGVALPSVGGLHPATTIEHAAIAAIVRIRPRQTRIGRIPPLTAWDANWFRIRTRCMIPSMRRLAHARELLDGELTDPDVLDGNLRDLRRINRQFGGARLSVRAVRALVTGAGVADLDLLRVLDVGAGACDIPLAITVADGPWRAVHVTAVDSRPEILDAARRIDPALAVRADIRLAVADGRSLPFPDGAFDVAHASMVVHHLDAPDGQAFLRELARVARLGIVVNDLERGLVHWLGAWLVLHALTRNRFTLHDGPLSVRRAYTLAEMRDLLAAAGLRPISEVRGFAGHRWAIAAVRSSTPVAAQG
jgi:SAM-dependent methyltransferase